MDLPPVYVLEEVLLNREEPIAKRMRALFYLRTIGTEEVIPVLCKAFSDPSLLLQHEICYVLGQINLKESISFLVSVLKDESIAGISRHEAAEAIAAIGDQDSISLLRQYENDKEEILADTCRLAIKRIEWLQTNEETQPNFCFSIDPAPPYDISKSFEWLVSTYHDTNLSLFDRYRALFSLRNICNDTAVLAICEGLGNQKFSDLFQHEIAFVLGQMQEKANKALPFLASAVRDSSLHYVIRHEAAEAIGSITDDPLYLSLLRDFENDPEEPVASSCKIALDLSEYWFSTS